MRSTRGRTTTGKPFTEPPQKNGKRTYRNLERKSPDFEILEVGGGLHCKRYLLEIKLKAIEYAQFVVEDGKGPAGTVGISYATRALGTAD